MIAKATETAPMIAAIPPQTPRTSARPFRPAIPTATRSSAPAGARAGSVQRAEPKPRKVHYASLLATYQAPTAKTEAAEPAAPERFMPFGTLLKCKLVNTVDSANLETPVIAMLLEDVWQNGKKVVPANTLVHGTARAGRMRDRVTAMGAWRFVWQDGRELVFNGVALDREYEHEIDGYGITEAWKTTRGEGVTIAIIDTGVDATHPDLVGAVVAGEDFTGNGRGGKPVAGQSHVKAARALVWRRALVDRWSGWAGINQGAMDATRSP